MIRIESLEERVLWSVTMHPAYLLSHPNSGLLPMSTASPTGLTPAQIRGAYGIKNIKFGTVPGDGRGQTIAIVDAYHAPTIKADLDAFNKAFGLPAVPSFKVVAQDGSANYPPVDPESATGSGNTWALESALDVQWAHAIAPAANILLVEANSPTDADLWAAVDYARNQPGVVAVSMSFGGPEDASITSTDFHFTTPVGHTGVSFFASAGDAGAFDALGAKAPEYPASSPNVVAVGGTYLSVSTAGTYLSETGWGSGNTSNTDGGGGGGISSFELKPSYQNGVATQSTTRRTIPDIALVADPNSGVPVYDSFDLGSTKPWTVVGGTSLSAPCWAGLAAILAQGRSLAGKKSLDGRTQLLPALYSISASNYHDITSGNNGYPAGSGYDLVTGRGTPKADLLIPALVSYVVPPPPPPPVAPLNDAFASAIKLTGTSATAAGTNIAATKQAGEPSHAGNVGGASIWYKWTPATSGTAVVTLSGSNFDTLLGIYTGSTISTLTTVASNDDSGSGATSAVSFSATAGKTYYFAVDGYRDKTGTAATGTLSLSLTETFNVAPANDNFAAAKVISGANVTVTGSNLGATRQPGEPLIAGNSGGKSVWFSWTATGNGVTSISLAGSSFDTLLSVYKGTSVTALTLVKSNDDESATILTSKLTFTAVKGTVYRIAVDGYNTGTVAAGAAAGNIKLQLTGPALAATKGTTAMLDGIR